MRIIQGRRFISSGQAYWLAGPHRLGGAAAADWMIQLARRRLSKASHPSLSSSSAAPPPPSAFVSKHFAVSLSELKSVVESMRTEFRVAGDHLEVKHCKLCSKGNRDKPDNLWKLYVNSNGSFCCFRCNEKGSWFELKRRAAPGGGGGEGGGDPVYLDSLLTLPGGSNSGGSYRGSTNSSSNGMKLGPTGSGAALRSAVAVPDQSAAFQYTKVFTHRSSFSATVNPLCAICLNDHCNYRHCSRSIGVPWRILC